MEDNFRESLSNDKGPSKLNTLIPALQLNGPHTPIKARSSLNKSHPGLLSLACALSRGLKIVSVFSICSDSCGNFLCKPGDDT